MRAWRCRAAAVAPGRTAKFRIEQAEGRPVDGFVINHAGGHYAYVNRCPHAGTALDWGPSQFLTEDGLHLVCATHGAVFAPATGICLEGPCPGARLLPLRVERDGDELVITWPN